MSWPIRLAVAALMVFVLGHVLFIVVVSYQLTHWDAVTAPSRATYALDDHGAGMAAMWFMLVGALVVSALVILVLGMLLTSMLRGSRTAWRGICVLLCCYLVLCGIALPGFTGQADRIDRSDNVGDYVRPGDSCVGPPRRCRQGLPDHRWGCTDGDRAPAASRLSSLANDQTAR